MIPRKTVVSLLFILFLLYFVIGRSRQSDAIFYENVFCRVGIYVKNEIGFNQRYELHTSKLRNLLDLWIFTFFVAL